LRANTIEHLPREGRSDPRRQRDRFDDDDNQAGVIISQSPFLQTVYARLMCGHESDTIRLVGSVVSLSNQPWFLY
jgi:hypothetical protein